MAVLSSDSRFGWLLQFIRTADQHATVTSAPASALLQYMCYCVSALLQYHPHCVWAIRTAATVRPHCARTFPLRPNLCGSIDIRVFARILMKSLLYHFQIGARPEIHLSTLFGHIANRVSALSTFLRFSLFFFIFCKLKPSKRSNLILGVFYSLYIQNTRYLVLFRDKNQIEYVYNLGLSKSIWSR